MDNKFELPREGVRIYDPKSGWQDSAQSGLGQIPPADVVDPEQRHEEDPDDFEGAHEHDAHDDEYDNQAYDDQELNDDHNLESDDVPKDNQNYLQDKLLADELHSDDRYNAGQANSAQPDFSESSAPSPEEFAAQALRSLSENLSSGGAISGYAGPAGGKPIAGLVPQGQAAALAKVGDSLDGLFTVIQRSTLANTVDGSAPSWRDVANISRHLEGRLNTRQQLLKELSGVDREIRNTRDDLLVTLKALSEFEQQNLQAASMRASISSVAARVIAKRFEESGES